MAKLQENSNSVNILVRTFVRPRGFPFQVTLARPRIISVLQRVVIIFSLRQAALILSGFRIR